MYEHPFNYRPEFVWETSQSKYDRTSRMAERHSRLEIVGENCTIMVFVQFVQDVEVRWNALRGDEKAVVTYSQT